MKITDIITESMDLTAMALKLPYGAAGSEYDRQYNPEIVDNIEKEYKRYKKIGDSPLFTKSEKNDAEKFTTKPKPNENPSSGYIGREKALKRAGIKTDSTKIKEIC